jgi:stearoyl-CoA desaturase (delta-9 desaturase)
VLIGLLLPTLLGALFLGSWMGGLLGFLWGGLVRLFLVHHVTWSVNSVCHLWGRQPFPGHDQSRNNIVLGILALGEGWHNNHHAYPNAARHGLLWWQLDASYWIIRALAALGLAWNVRCHPKEPGPLNEEKTPGR